ncbi:MAG: hypothetical protein ACYTFT_02635 [Planctomycetota bacterium]|jgi:hypothetical protein
MFLIKRIAGMVVAIVLLVLMLDSGHALTDLFGTTLMWVFRCLALAVLATVVFTTLKGKGAGGAYSSAAGPMSRSPVLDDDLS